MLHPISYNQSNQPDINQSIHRSRSSRIHPQERDRITHRVNDLSSIQTLSSHSNNSNRHGPSSIYTPSYENGSNSNINGYCLAEHSEDYSTYPNLRSNLLVYNDQSFQQTSSPSRVNNLPRTHTDYTMPHDSGYQTHSLTYPSTTRNSISQRPINYSTREQHLNPSMNDFEVNYEAGESTEQLHSSPFINGALNGAAKGVANCIPVLATGPIPYVACIGAHAFGGGIVNSLSSHDANQNNLNGSRDIQRINSQQDNRLDRSNGPNGAQILKSGIIGAAKGLASCIPEGMQGGLSAYANCIATSAGTEIISNFNINA